MRGALPLSIALALAGCGPEAEDPPGFEVVRDTALDRPLFGANADELARFNEGDALFDLPHRPADGLGPVYVRTSCGACHQQGGRGPGAVEKVVVVEADGITPSEDQSALPWGNTLRPYFTAGATRGLLAPEEVPLLRSQRLGPPIFGRGYLEAIADEEIERLEQAQSMRADGISGRIHRVREAHTGRDGLIGRFGLKARIASLGEFTADAFQGDMGLTTPLRPTELPNPDGLTDDDKPGIDVELETVRAVTDYVRLVEIPTRRPADAQGRALFEQVQCATCHVPTMKTRSDYPISALAGIDAPVFTDLLLHDMGDGLADGLAEGGAGPREWRTAPLIGLKWVRAYLHDGRARTIEQAVLLHEGPGSEANDSISKFRALSAEERTQLLDYVGQL